MSCYDPMIMIKTSDMTDPEARALVNRLSMLKKLSHRNVKGAYNVTLIPRSIYEGEARYLKKYKGVTVPCGHCIGCYLDYSRQWAMRAIFETKSHDHNYFLTIDYDDDHLPIGREGIPTLMKSEMSAFMKRLRSAMKDEYGVDGVRFFGCGEYGLNGERILHPHYHIILFNCPLKDLQERHPIPVDGEIKWIRQYDSDGTPLLYSPLIGKCWNKGRATIGQVTFESCAYVARYVLKKEHNYNASEFMKLGVEPEFVNMSRNPGIGYQYFVDHFDDIVETDNVNFKRGDKVITCKPGKYFDKIFKQKYEQLFYERKEKRSKGLYDGVDCKEFEGVDLAINNHRAKEVKEHQIKLLKRNL